MESMFGHLDIIIYLDDLLGHAKTKGELLKKLRTVFTVCQEKGLKLNPIKCDLATLEVLFCGRVINKDGVKFKPQQYDALTNMQAPTTVGDLMELVHGEKWMITAIRNFSQLIAPLHDLIEANYTLHGTCKKTRLMNRPVPTWRTSTKMQSIASLRR